MTERNREPLELIEKNDENEEPRNIRSDSEEHNEESDENDNAETLTEIEQKRAFSPITLNRLNVETLKPSTAIRLWRLI